MGEKLAVGEWGMFKEDKFFLFVREEAVSGRVWG